jgi:hypothetical protein
MLDSVLAFFGRIGGAIAGLIALGGFIIFMLNNDIIQEYLKDAVNIPELTIQISDLTNQMTKVTTEIRDVNSNVQDLAGTLKSMKTIGELSSDPIIKFLEGSYITDGRIGDTVTFYIRFVKVRECGRADLNAWFKNGVKAIHSFEDVSIVDDTGKAIRVPASPSDVLERTWTAKIPVRAGVTPGKGEGWVEVSYPNCPLVPVATSPVLSFEILDDDGRPVERQIERNRN